MLDLLALDYLGEVLANTAGILVEHLPQFFRLSALVQALEVDVVQVPVMQDYDSHPEGDRNARKHDDHNIEEVPNVLKVVQKPEKHGLHSAYNVGSSLLLQLSSSLLQGFLSLPLLLAVTPMVNVLFIEVIVRLTFVLDLIAIIFVVIIASAPPFVPSLFL